MTQTQQMLYKRTPLTKKDEMRGERTASNRFLCFLGNHGRGFIFVWMPSFSIRDEAKERTGIVFTASWQTNEDKTSLPYGLRGAK